MLNIIKTVTAAVVVAGLTVGPAMAGETVNYKGSGTYTAQKLTLTLGNGDIVFAGWNEGVATISTDPPMLLFSKCMGLGRVTENDDFSNDVYCTFRANDADAFDVKGHSDSEGGKGEIIGGSGRWAGATGAVRMKRESQTENSGTYTFELELTTP